MVTYKLALDERRAKQDGTYPLVVRVTHNRKVLTFQSGVYLLKDHWNSKTLLVNKTNENWADLSHKVSDYFVKVQKAILTIEREQEFTFDALKIALNPIAIPTRKIVTFKSYSDKIIDDMMKVKRTGNALVYLTAVNRLMTYADNSNLKFEDIDFTFIDSFVNKLAQDKLKNNSIGNYLRSIRAIYNKAIKAKIVARELYPFHDISIKTEKTAKRAIRVDELSKIYNYPKKINSQEWHSANYLFLSFALRGISFTDMAYLKAANINNGFLTYKRRKTKKLYTIKLHPVAIKILNCYKNNGTSYLLPIFPSGTVEDGEQAKKITRQWIKVTNKYLNKTAFKCNLPINLTTYVIRHTWGTTAKRLGYSNELIAECMGHEYGNKITNIYLDDFEQTLVDGVNDKVILTVIPCLKQIIHEYKYALIYVNDRGLFKYQVLNLSQSKLSINLP